MKTGKITAKLRDAVPVCLMVNGTEVKRYRNIELPDMLKEVEMLDFHFHIPADGKITFEISYAEGVLPETFPEARAKATRTAKTAGRAQTETATEAGDTQTQDEAALAAIPETQAIPSPADTEEAIAEADMAGQAAEAMEPAESAGAASMEISYNVTGPRRKELAAAVGDFIGAAPVYMRAPTYAFAIGSYTIDRNGTLSGAQNEALAEALAAQGFTAA